MKNKIFSTCVFLGFLFIGCIFLQSFFKNSAYALKIDLRGEPEKIEQIDKQYVPLIKEFCKELKKDGRAGKLGEIASNSLDAKSSCGSCKDFFRKIKNFCTVNKALMTKKGNTVQREPSLMVIYYTSKIFSMLANDKDLSDAGIKISMLISYSLKHSSPQTKGEEEYYEMLSEYIQEPFKNNIGVIKSVAESNDEKKILDDVFGK